MKIVFPSEPYSNLKKVDSNFAEEYDTAKSLGLDCYLFDFDEFNKRNILVSNLLNFEKLTHFVYRGWQMSPNTYDTLFTHLYENRGVVLINDYFDYRNFHLYDSPYKTIPRFFQKSWVFEHSSGSGGLNLSLLRNIDCDQFFIKDFVKSEPDLMKVANDINVVENVNRFINLRGKSYQSGIVLKRWTDDIKRECRYFIHDTTVVVNDDATGEYLEFIHSITSDVNFNSKLNPSFFVIDVATINGEMKVVEMGDAQVCGLKRITSLDFYSSCSKLFL